ncbi:MAG: hypothetical protein LBI53_01565 [Candidatus Peribacteria bacterium]|jgi:hypothetical protein|nr:hypothetical protein [Candidatus Peribacteria bacterium]
MKKFMVLGIVFGVLLSSFSFALGLKENEKFFYNPTPVATEVDEVSESENIGKIFAE